MAEVRLATGEEWDAAARSPSATYFHTRSWAALWQRVTDGHHRPAARWIAFDDGASTVVPMSRSLRVRGTVRHYESTVTGKYGGWLSADRITPEHVSLIWRSIPRRSLLLRENPFAPLPTAPGGATVRADSTRVLLLDRTWPDLLKGFTKGHRSAVHKAERLGVEVRVGTTRADWQAYFAVYQDSLRRWGSAAQTAYPWRLFDELGSAGETVDLWLAEYEKEVVAGAVILRHGANLTYWHGSVLEQAMALGSSHLVLGRVMEHHAGSGAVLDFNPSGGLTGVEHFKKGFGTDQRTSNVYESRSWPERIVRAARRRP